MIRVLLFLNVTILALAQTPAEPEIRGTVTEFGVSAPITGAQVVVSEFVVIDSTLTRKPITTVYADSRGSFSYKPGHIGRFWVEARRDGYRSPQADATFVAGVGYSEASVELTQQRMVGTMSLMLFRPGTLTGRVLDEDGNPTSNVVLTLIQPGIMTPLLTTKTDNDGNFTFTGLPASSRLIQIGPASAQAVDVMDTFTEQDVKLVDRDFETSYWPGGAREPDQALPIEVTPGATVNVGTFRARKIPYYRVHLTFEGQCEVDESWVVMIPESLASITPPTLRPAKCRKELMLRMLRPGSRTLAIMARSGDSRKWALLQLNIRDENVEAAVNFSPSEDVPVRFVDRDDGAVPAIANARLMLFSATGFAEGVSLNGKDPIVRNVVLSRQEIVLAPPPSNIAIHEIRYNRSPVLDGAFNIVHGALLEIVVDQRPASLSFTGTAAGATVLLAKWPSDESLALFQERPPYMYIRIADGSGTGRITALPSGEFRLAAIPAAEISRARNPQTLLDLLSKGEKITLERGEQKSIEIKR